MKLVDTPIALIELAMMAEAGFRDLVKAVVDIRLGVMAVDGELHSTRSVLLRQGPDQADLWGSISIPTFRLRVGQSSTR
jgi:hypothetical protein